MLLSFLSFNFSYSCLSNLKYHITDNGKSFLYIFIGKTKYCISFFIQFSTAPFIIAFAAVGIMLGSIDFNNQFCFPAGEISNKRRFHILPPEMKGQSF